MKFIITSELSHKTNSEYQGVLVQFSEKDKHYFPDKMNWLPKTSEAYALHQLMLALDSNYRQLVSTEKKENPLINSLQIALQQLGIDFQKFKVETANFIAGGGK